MPTPTRRPFVARATLAGAIALFCLGPALHAGDSVKRYGVGTAGSGNIVPQIWASTTPRPGDANFRVQVERALGGSYGIFFLSTQKADFTFGGVRFLVDPSAAHLAGSFFLDGNGDGAGRGSFGIAIPGSTVLVGHDFFAQVYTLDDFAPNPLGFGATQGLRITPTLPGQLIAARAHQTQPEPQTAIDLRSGVTLDFDQGTLDDGVGIAYSPDGSLLFVAAPTHGKVQIFEARAFPPRWIKNALLAGTGRIDLVAISPDGSRAYLVPNDRTGTSPTIEVLDAAGGLTLGQPHTAGNLRIKGIADLRAILFRADAERAFLVSEAGGDGSGATLILIDVRLGSPTYHRELGRVTFPGLIATAGVLAPDDTSVYVALTRAGGSAEVAIVDATSLAVLDADAIAPGIQNLGGELSRARTPLPGALTRIVAEPRGGALYFGTVGGIGWLGVDAATVAFGRVITTTAGIPHTAPIVDLVIADAGERVYFATATTVVELDPLTLARARSWPIANTFALALR